MPGIPSQTVTIPFTGGVDEKKDPWLLEAGKAGSIINGVFTKSGQIRKRFGISLQSNVVGTAGAPAIASGKQIMFRKDEQLLVDGAALYSFSPGGGYNLKADLVPAPTVTRTGVFNGTSNFSDPDVATGNGFEVYVWKSGDAGVAGDIYASVIDPNGTPILTNVQLTTGTTKINPHIIIIGTLAIVVYAEFVGTNISARTLDLTNPVAWTAATNLITDFTGAGSAAFDVALVGGTTNFVIAYELNAGINRLRLNVFNNTGFSIASATLLTEGGVTGFTSIGVMSNANELLYLAYSYFNGATGETRCVGCDPSTLAQQWGPLVLLSSATAGSTSYSIGIVRYSATGAVITYQLLVAPTLGPGACMQRITSAGANAGTRRATACLYIVGKPFTYGGRFYVQCVSSPQYANQGTTFICDLQVDESGWSLGVAQFRVVSTVAPRITNNAGTNLMRTAGSLCSVPSTPTTGIFASCATIIRNANVKGLLGLVRLAVDFTSTNRWQPAELGESLHLTGGTPLAYDGRCASEIGFYQYVNAASITAVASTIGGGLAAQPYRYIFVWEWVDARGQIHRSAASAVVVVDHSASGTATNVSTFTTIPMLHSTNRQDDGNGGNPRIALVAYRTTYVGGVMSTVFRRLTEDSVVTALSNNPAGNTISFTDDGIGIHSDTVVSANPLLYTTGGVLDNVCPPSSTLAVVHKDRLWLAGCDDPNTVWYSKRFTQGEAVAFCDSFTFSLNDAGPITAIASLDDKFIIFKKSGIYFITGDGPPDTGAGNDLSAPQKIASDVGCIQPRSVVLTPDGLMFQSVEGIMLLDRSLQVHYIGAPVEDTLKANPIITAAVLVGAQNQVRFMTQSSDGAADGTHLIYNYAFRLWTFFEYTTTVGARSSCASACMSPSGVFTWVTTTGRVYTEKTAASASAFLDGPTNTWVTLTVISAWFSKPALFQRIRKVSLLGNRVTPLNFDMHLSVNRRSSPDQDASWEWQTLGVTNPALGSPMQVTMRVGSQDGMSPRCESIRVHFEDSDPTNTGPEDPDPLTGEGATYTSIALEVAAKPGIRRQGAAAKA